MGWSECVTHKGIQREESRHHTLIIAKEQEVQAGQAGDGELELDALEAEVTFLEEHDDRNNKETRRRKRQCSFPVNCDYYLYEAEDSRRVCMEHSNDHKDGGRIVDDRGNI